MLYWWKKIVKSTQELHPNIFVCTFVGTIWKTVKFILRVQRYFFFLCIFTILHLSKQGYKVLIYNKILNRSQSAFTHYQNWSNMYIIINNKVHNIKTNICPLIRSANVFALNIAWVHNDIFILGWTVPLLFQSLLISFGCSFINLSKPELKQKLTTNVSELKIEL